LAFFLLGLMCRYIFLWYSNDIFHATYTHGGCAWWHGLLRCIAFLKNLESIKWDSILVNGLILSFIFPSRLDSISWINAEWKQQSCVHGAIAAQATSCRKSWHQLHERWRALTGCPSPVWQESCRWHADLRGWAPKSSFEFSKVPQSWRLGHPSWTLVWYWWLPFVNKDVVNLLFFYVASHEQRTIMGFGSQ